jgi:hypothetical protein
LMQINGWITSCLFSRELCSVFHCQEHSSFHSYRSTSVLFFCYCVKLLFFALIFVQILLYLCIKVYLDHWSMLVFFKRVVSKWFEWCWKRKKFHAKKWYKKEPV